MLPPEHAPNRETIKALRADLLKQMGKDKEREIDIAQGVANRIFENERRMNSRFLLVDDRPCLFSAINRTLLDIGANKKWNAYLSFVYGLNAKDRVQQIVTQFLESHAIWFGEKRSVRRWVCYQDGTLNISNYDGTTWRITGAGVEMDEKGKIVDDGWVTNDNGSIERLPIGIGIVPNGEQVVFGDDDEGTPVAMPEIGRNGSLFKLIGSITWAGSPTWDGHAGTPGGLKPKHQTLAMIIWMFAIAFPDLFPTKPLLIIEGAAGGGKSLSLQMIQAALHGCIQPVIVSENGEKDFRVSLLRSPITVLDNTDEYIKWLPNALAAYATGAGWADRELYTNQGIVKLRPHAFVAVASKNPVSFRQDDVADRSIILRTERRKDARDRRIMKRRRVPIEEKAGSRSAKIFADIEANRNQLYGEWLYYLNRIVSVINQGLMPDTADHRMADWEAFAYAVARAFNWREETIVDLMRALQGERGAFASENDVVVELLEQWLDFPQNDGRELTAQTLFKELRMLAELDGKPFVKSPLTLAHRLRAPHVVERFLVTDSATDRAGRRIYQVSRSFTLDVSSETAMN